jgi:hypothetical protein
MNEIFVIKNALECGLIEAVRILLKRTLLIFRKRLSSDNELNKTAFADYFGALEGSDSRKSMDTLKDRRTMCTEVYRDYIESLPL